MAPESQAAVLEFESEEARQKAIDEVDERNPDNEATLDKIMSAPIKKKDEAAHDKPASSEATPPKEPEPRKEEKPPETPATPPPTGGDDAVFTIKRSELPQGFDTPGKLMKSYNEAQSLIERQTRFIKEKLGGSDSTAQELQKALQRASSLETELAEVRKKNERPAQRETDKENLSPIPESKATQIEQTLSKLRELVKDPIGNEEEIHRLSVDLNGLYYEENKRNALLVERATKEASEARAEAQEATSKATSWIAKSEQSEAQAQASKALQKEYRDIDDFASSKDYPEFRMSKPAAQVEQEYASWAQEVTKLYYGAPVDISTPDGGKAMRHALAMLEKGAPDITEKCNVAGIPIQPSEDVKRYLEICGLLDYRDGYRTDPTTGKRELVQRYHAPTGQMVPDAFPSLSAAYEDRKVRDGYYKDRIRKAFVDGGSQMAEAISKRDTGAVEMDNASGVSKRDAGLSMTVHEAQKVIDETDEIDALRRRKAGDPSLYNKLSEAMKTLGMSPLD